MVLPRYKHKITLHDALDQFDLALEKLVKEHSLENAVNTNIASMRWYDALYTASNYYEGIPNGFAAHYIEDINKGLHIIHGMKEYQQKKHHELVEVDPEAPELEEVNHNLRNLESCIIQMRSRKRLVADLVPKVPDHH